ncbi:hypothetical protein DL771_009450 [Monosporascus sp. 5C6A]|nr:hypothetical protein DL771_009450 [Monosporascus sp. 5C6A]
MQLTTTLFFAVAVPLAESAAAYKRLDNGIGRTPAMGWNSWNIAGCAYANATSALSTAKAFVSLGLKDLGYTYVNIDDCWSSKSRNSSGYLVPDPIKWPQGMKAVADQIHGMGLKFGLYGCSGTMTCERYPGSQGYESQDAKTLASWGVDYWKYDNCFTPSGNSSSRFMKMRDALAGANRPILYSMCQWGNDRVWEWAMPVGNSWRMSGDIRATWASISSIAAAAGDLAKYAGPGGFNDLDMMEVGNKGLTTQEERTHMGIWAMAKSPIILGTDLTQIKSSSLEILKNKAIIAINQDPLGKAAGYFQPKGASAPVSGQLYPYWAGPLSDGVVVGLIAVNGAATMKLNFADVPGLGSGTYKWTELWTNTTGYGTGVSISLSAHDMAVYKVVNPTAS